ncbi:MAG: DNA polymerase [Patescibacteria group bacterium]
MLKTLPSVQSVDEALNPVLRQMEDRGVLLDVGYLETVAVDLADQLAELERQIFEAVGHPFLISSPKQLGQVIYSELHLDQADGVNIRKKTTGLSTGAAELAKLQGSHPVIDLILKYREVGKLLSTYVLPLPQLVDSSNRLHTSYAPNAASGRLSSRKPNLQNIPIRTELGRTIRRAFIASPGTILVSADYSQIELRVIAHLSQDPTMLEVFQTGGDIHAKTSEALGIGRRAAKAVNFGIFYGLSAYGLAESLAVSREEAQTFIDGYLGAYPVAAAYIDQLIRQARESGYAETMLGKRRLLPELSSHNEYIRRAAERVAINHPIQGTAAEIMKLAMVLVPKELADHTCCPMILQVHDELIFEVQADHLEAVAPRVVKVMEGVIELAIPLLVDLETGPNWAEMVARPRAQKNTVGL